MKKVFLFLGLLAIVFVVILTLIGLQWWLVILLTAIGVLLNFMRIYISGKILANKTWLCPKCGIYFNIREWYKLGLLPKVNRSYMMRIQCPHCNNAAWCKRVLARG